MKAIALLIILMYLLLPLACYAHPCASCLVSPDIVDTSGTPDNHSHNQDADNCDSTFCCAVCTCQHSPLSLTYAPIVSEIAPAELQHNLPSVVIPIFIPPQNHA